MGGSCVWSVKRWKNEGPKGGCSKGWEGGREEEGEAKGGEEEGRRVAGGGGERGRRVGAGRAQNDLREAWVGLGLQPLPQFLRRTPREEKQLRFLGREGEKERNFGRPGVRVGPRKGGPGGRRSGGGISMNKKGKMIDTRALAHTQNSTHTPTHRETNAHPKSVSTESNTHTLKAAPTPRNQHPHTLPTHTQKTKDTQITKKFSRHTHTQESNKPKSNKQLNHQIWANALANVEQNKDGQNRIDQSRARHCSLSRRRKHKPHATSTSPTTAQDLSNCSFLSSVLHLISARG